MAETEQVKQNLQALVKKTEVGVKLKKLKNPLGIGLTTGIGRRKPKGSGGGSPYTEETVAHRQYHDTVEYTSSDGLFTLATSPIKKITMEDGSGEEAIFNYADPDPE